MKRLTLIIEVDKGQIGARVECNVGFTSAENVAVIGRIARTARDLEASYRKVCPPAALETFVQAWKQMMDEPLPDGSVVGHRLIMPDRQLLPRDDRPESEKLEEEPG